MLQSSHRLNRGRTICPHRTGANWCGKFSGQLLAAAQKSEFPGPLFPTERKVTRSLIPRCGWMQASRQFAQGTLAKAKSIPNG
jgi:hypothetical protein